MIKTEPLQRYRTKSCNIAVCLQPPRDVVIFLTFKSDIENEKFALPPWKALMKYRVVVCSCLDAGILVAAQCTNTCLVRLETDLIESLHPHRSKKHHVPPHWTHLLIDEASSRLKFMVG